VVFIVDVLLAAAQVFRERRIERVHRRCCAASPVLCDARGFCMLCRVARRCRSEGETELTLPSLCLRPTLSQNLRNTETRAQGSQGC
jgi:hypothetical protein